MVTDDFGGQPTRIPAKTDDQFEDGRRSVLLRSCAIKPHAMMISAAILLGATAVAAQDEVGREMQALRGEWKLVSMEMSGEKIPEKDLGLLTWTFEGNGLLVGEGGRADRPVTYALDPTKMPKTIDVGRRGDPKAAPQLGIYALEGDTLRVVLWHGGRDTRPKGFAPSKDPTTSLVFMRPAAADAMRADREKKRRDGAEKDMAAMQGEWKVVRAEAVGAPAPDAAVQKMQVWVFKGDQLIQKAEDGRTLSMTYTLDPLQTPKTIDVGRPDAQKARPMLGIYSLDGGQLRLCMNVTGTFRPEAFATKQDQPPTEAYVFERPGAQPSAQPIAAEPTQPVKDNRGYWVVGAIVAALVLALVVAVAALRRRGNRGLTRQD